MPRGAVKGDGRMGPAIAAAARVNHQRMLDQLATGKRWCPACSLMLPVGCFGRNRANPSGLAAYCRPCAAADRRRRYHLAAEAERQRQAEEQRQAERQRRAEKLRQWAEADHPARNAAWYAQRAADERARKARRVAEKQDQAVALHADGAPVLAGWVTKCCGAVMVDAGPGQGWAIEHRAGCRDRWQVSGS